MKEKILEILKSKVSRKNWKLWFNSFDVKEVGEDKIVFKVGNLFIKEWLERKYGSIIKRVIREAFGKEIPYEIVYESVERVHSSEPLIRKRPLVITPLNPHYTFENFVEGPGNTFAYRVSLEVAKNPGRYNPLFIYGGVGLGKTHLLQAIGNYLFVNEPDLKIMYLTSEKFLNELINAMKSDEMNEFREKHRKKVDVFLLDDVQFLMGKSGIQLELFHTFNELYDSGKQIVICSDRTPEELADFQERLVSRFQMGIVVRIDPPDEHTRINIARKMVEMEDGDLDKEVIDFVALSIPDNLRRMKGAIIKLLAYQDMTGEKVSIQKAKELLGDILTRGNSIDSFDKLLNALSKTFGIPKAEILGNSRKQEVVLARQVGMLVSKKYLKMSIRTIAERFNRSHPSVLTTIKKLEDAISKGNKTLKSHVDSIINIMHGMVGNGGLLGG